MTENYRKLFKEILALSIATLLIGCTEPKDKTILIVRSEMLTELESIDVDCENTPKEALQNSPCLKKMKDLSAKVTKYSTPENSEILTPVVNRLNVISKKVYKRYFVETNIQRN
mgnify:CR=1 FL=1